MIHTEIVTSRGRATGEGEERGTGGAGEDGSSCGRLVLHVRDHREHD